MPEEQENVATVEPTDDSPFLDPSNVDENGIEKGFKPPETQENTTENEIKTPVKKDVPEESSTSPQPEQTSTFDINDFGSIEENMKFLTQGFDETVDIPGQTKQDPIQQAPVPPVVDAPAVEEPISHAQKFLDSANPVIDLYNQFIDAYPSDIAMAKTQFQRHMDNESQMYGIREDNRIERESIQKEREDLTKTKKVEASRPIYNQNMHEVAVKRGYKNAAQLHENLYKNPSSGKTLAHIFNNLNKGIEYKSTEERGKAWESFNVEYGSNKENLEFLEELTRKDFICSNIEKYVQARINAITKTNAQKEKGMNPRVNQKTNIPRKTKPSESPFLQINT